MLKFYVEEVNTRKGSNDLGRARLNDSYWKIFERGEVKPIAIVYNEVDAKAICSIMNGSNAAWWRK
jgi:hypothetical protein